MGSYLGRLLWALVFARISNLHLLAFLSLIVSVYNQLHCLSDDSSVHCSPSCSTNPRPPSVSITIVLFLVHHSFPIQDWSLLGAIPARSISTVFRLLTQTPVILLDSVLSHPPFASQSPFHYWAYPCIPFFDVLPVCQRLPFVIPAELIFYSAPGRFFLHPPTF